MFLFRVFWDVFIFIIVELTLLRYKEAQIKIKWLIRVHHVLNDVVVEKSWLRR